MGIVGASLIGLSIATFASYTHPVSFLVEVIIVAITSIGAIMILDSVIRFAKKSTTAAVVEIVFGAILLTFGILFICIEDFKTYLWVIFGVLLAIYGLYSLVYTLVKLKK